MSFISDESTIAAIATGLSPAGISIVRLSGPDCVSIADRHFITKDNKRILLTAGSHKLHYGFFCNGENILDEVLVSVMRGPNSYTGEDVVEFNCHGGIYITSLILDVLLNDGAVLALPGEFTKRAFLNGRIDLAKAEAVMDLISSENELSRRVSMSHLNGNLSEKIRKLRDDLIESVAFIESSLDDPEHYELDGYGVKLRSLLESQINEISSLSMTFNEGRIIKGGVRTVILGKPNAGKSSVMNLLSGRDRSIVTDIPGTTRDILEEDIKIRDIGLTLVDTAGIRDTGDLVERIGVQKSLDSVKDADLIIYVCDSSMDLDENDEQIIRIISESGLPVIFLLNKSDKDIKVDVADLKKFVLDIYGDAFSCETDYFILFSALEGIGLDELKNTVHSLFIKGDVISSSDSLIITNERHFRELKRSAESLKLVIKSIDDGIPEDFYIVDLMQAYQSLGSIIGEEVGDDLVNEIFSKFCMGK